MLTVTDRAASAIAALLQESDASDGAGLRIVADDSFVEFRLSISPAPHDGDTVIALPQAAVFVAPDAMRLLEGLALDAEVDATRGLRFGVTGRRRFADRDGDDGDDGDDETVLAELPERDPRAGPFGHAARHH
jgi:Fe-S cluster assembly iron-binding protein IscA